MHSLEHSSVVVSGCMYTRSDDEDKDDNDGGTDDDEGGGRRGGGRSLSLAEPPAEPYLFVRHAAFIHSHTQRTDNTQTHTDTRTHACTHAHGGVGSFASVPVEKYPGEQSSAAMRSALAVLPGPAHAHNCSCWCSANCPIRHCLHALSPGSSPKYPGSHGSCPSR